MKAIETGLFQLKRFYDSTISKVFWGICRNVMKNAQIFFPTLSIMRFWLQNWNFRNQYNVEYSNMLVSHEEKIINKGSEL